MHIIDDALSLNDQKNTCRTRRRRNSTFKIFFFRLQVHYDYLILRTYIPPAHPITHLHFENK